MRAHRQAIGLGKTTVVEHVGSERAMALLRGYGVEYAQGVLLGTPVPAGSIAEE